ncbi:MULTISPECIES: hypothetical protein [unclassified Rhizobium]|uniref:hypothetical protein n=1 Tax=unclassified Rhizobium TaxID=2613769 RepID=UPI00160ADB7B|nr:MULTISPECIES: hypothetical protein [unclassified Rhizobium]MBB3288138.1 hypothetical protein [Rhizobium sp. BK252]MBB3402998.1 hypothetical protein [Rhizobium sp. BK289]MBB3415575.1 hypothetical protein [Rhizobium sp. BK284]MBB3483344.1 hypothetical protein [Rhizobium sp. BK347]
MLESAASLQLVWFTTGAELASPMHLFHEMFGRDPDAFQKLQPPQAPFPMTMQAFEDNGVEHRLHSHPGRIDYLISGVQRTHDIPLLEAKPAELVGEALKVAARGAQDIGNINRAAVILTLSKKLGSSSEASDFFTKLFGGVVDFSGSIDLQFQMNRRIEGGLEGTDINRLLKWVCNTVQVQQVVNLPGTFGQTLASELVEYLQLNYMIDVNSAVSASIYQPSQHQAIFSKLASVALDQVQFAKIQDV